MIFVQIIVKQPITKTNYEIFLRFLFRTLAILAIACSQAHSSEASSPLSDLIAGPLLDSKGKEVDKKFWRKRPWVFTFPLTGAHPAVPSLPIW